MKKNKKIILFQPGMGFYGLFFRNMPIGLLSISTYLWTDYDMVIIDQRLPGWKEKVIYELETGALCLGITCLTGLQISCALYASKIAKERFPDIPVIWGGAHPTALPTQTLKSEFIDFIVRGEGEKTFEELVRALDNKNKAYESIYGLSWKKKTTIVNNEKRPRSNLNSLPDIPYHLIDFNDYTLYSALKFGKIATLETARGCYYKCSFCYNLSLYPGGPSFLSANLIFEKIKMLKQKYDIDGVILADDSFLSNYKRFEELIILLEKNPIGIQFFVEANIYNIKKICDDLLERASKVGFSWLSIGVESGSDRILKKIRKPLKIHEVYSENRRIKKWGYAPKYNFMCGFIGEKQEDLKKTTGCLLQLIKENQKATIAPVSICTPYPGTGYFKEALTYGFVPPESLEEWSRFNPEDWYLHAPWIGVKEKRQYEALGFFSICIDSKHTYTLGQSFFSWCIKLIVASYRPVARFRIKQGHYRFLPELYIYRFIKYLAKMLKR